MFKKVLSYINLATCIAILLFTYQGWRNLDPDFGWHYKMGEIILNSGIPATDPFTYTMPSYPFVDYEWGTNVLMYYFYTEYGKFTLAFLFALFAVFSLHIAVPTKYKKYALIPLLLGWSVMFSRVGIRPQVVGWFFFSLIVRLLFEKELWAKYKWILPMIMLFWANLHGSYPIAFILVGIIVSGRFIRARYVELESVFVYLLSLFATLLNPYGIHNWIEVVKQMGQTGLFRRTISEWQPFYVSVEFGLLLTFVFVGSIVWLYRKKFEREWLTITLLFLGMTISSLRHAPLFMIVSTPLLCFAQNDLLKTVSKIKHGKTRFNYVWYLFSFLSVIIFVLSFVFSVRNQISEDTFYPKKAVEYIQREDINGRIFNNYGWGGYLIWKLPEQKVFIDGRMSGFYWEAPEGESDFVFKDYLFVDSGKEGWETILNKYSVEYALLNSDSNFRLIEIDEGKRQILHTVYKWLLGWGGDIYISDTPLSIRLKEHGWSIIYQDDVSILLKRP